MLGSRTRAAELKAHTNPLSYGCTPNHLVRCERKQVVTLKRYSLCSEGMNLLEKNIVRLNERGRFRVGAKDAKSDKSFGN